MKAGLPVSVVIPARNAAAMISEVLRSVFDQDIDRELEVIVVDDGSHDDTAALAKKFPCRVVRRQATFGNPAAARNLGARETPGDPLVFLDSDCVARPGWLSAILRAHERGNAVVGGAIDMPEGLSFTARADYLCGFYLVHGRRPPARVPHHPPPSLSFRRDAFFGSGGFSESWPLYYTNEERAPLGRVRGQGGSIVFEPAAVVEHYNRPGLTAMLRRHYRWGFTSIESKSSTGSARVAWLYRCPPLTALLVPALAFCHSVMIVALWLRHGKTEIIWHVPLVLVSRGAYGCGMLAGVVDWYRRRMTKRSAARRWSSS